MVYLKWGFWGLFWTVLVAFLHYTLPQTDVVRVTDTYEQRVNPGDNTLFWTRADTGENPQVSGRDVFFIQTFRRDERPMVFRNEDTGWSWPPYFKFNAANLQAQAADMRTNRDRPNAQWIAVRHYGWRNEFLSIYPNAVGLWEVDGPEVRVIPWISIVLLGGLAVLFWTIRVRWKRFWRRREEWSKDEWSDGSA